MVVFFALLMFTYDLVLPLIGIGAVGVLAVVTLLVNRRRVDGNRRLLRKARQAR